MMRVLSIEPLAPDTFAPFGEVISVAAATRMFAINGGSTQRFHDLATVEIEGENAHAGISIFRAQPRALPFAVTMLERHPFGSQAFIPLSPMPYLIVVASDPQTPPRCFLASAGEGVNYRRGTWHHPLLALQRESDFLVVDRIGGGANCDEAGLSQVWVVEGLD